MNIVELGWNNYFKKHYLMLKNKGFVPARIAKEHKGIYQIISEEGEFPAQISGKFRYKAESYGEFPTVGDWVLVRLNERERKGIIYEVLPRKSKFARPAPLAGKTEEQVLAANIDFTFLVNGLVGDFNLRRIERYIAVSLESGSEPVIVLNKSDICDDVESKLEQVKEIAGEVPILLMSALRGDGLDNIRTKIEPGKTAVFLGSSGVGKTTIINGLIGSDNHKTGSVREFDGRGKHTTTHRELILLPSGGIVIDTPGLREISIWGDKDAYKSLFSDIEELAKRCKFRNCRHRNEPGCAVIEALKSDELDERRLRNFIRLQGEMINLQKRREEKTLQKDKRAKQKQISRYSKEIKKFRKKNLY